MINCDIKLRPFLHNYPFTVDNLKFGIIFENKSGKFADINHVAFVTLADGYLRYPQYDPITEEFFNHTSEPYQQALEIVRSQVPPSKPTYR